MVKKHYDTPVLEVVEIGFGALQCASPNLTTESPMTGSEDWDDYDI